MNNEIWKDIPEYEGLYQISNYGRVKSLEKYNYKGHHNLEKILKQIKCKNGYYYVALCKNRKVKKIQVHKLVANTFLENKKNYRCINHINGMKDDNRVENLEFCDHSYNEKEAYRIGLKKTIKTAQYDLDGNLIKIYNSRVEASKKSGAQASCIWRVCEGKGYTAGGYIWRYVDEL